jgi:predicted deacylase
VELRGQADVAPGTAAADAEGLYRFLVARGVIADARASPPGPWRGEAAPIWNVEMNRAPASGAILYHVRPGDRVAEGDLVAEILAAPGEEGGAVAVRAAQGGLVLTRRAHRLITPGDDLAKVIGARRADGARTGTLED